MLTKSAGLCLLALLVPFPAAPQTNPDVQKILERLDRLESENQKLLDEIRELRGELKAVRSPGAVNTEAASDATPPTPPANERLDVQESRTTELEQTKVAASQKFPISLTGMLLFNAFTNGRNGGGSQYPVAANLNSSAATEGASVRQTILGLKFNGPELPGGGKASGTLYMDFFAGSSAPGNSLLRIRTATLDLNWKNFTFTVGQDKPLISPRDPSSFAQVGVSPLTAAGNLWDWNPQVRIERRFLFGENTGFKAQAGVYETTETYSSTLPAEYSGTLERSRPAWQGRFEFFHGDDRRRIEIAPGFSVGTTHVVGDSVQSKIASIDWLIRPFPLLEFSGEAFNGQDVAGLGALPGFNILISDAVIPIHSHGEWGQIALFPKPRLSFHLYAGEQYNRGSDLAPSGIQRNFVYAGNVMYKLAPNVLAALEAAQVRTEYLSSALRLNNHYDLALAYLF
ncbi:MAG TPA: hypothetical protein VGL82_17310 [Bryobacteraceae bacterium]